MLQIVQGAGVVLLLSIFFAYVLVPIVDGVRRRARVGPRGRPISRATVIVAIYLVLIGVAFFVWNRSGDRIRHLVHVSAPAAIDRLFGAGDGGPVERLLHRIPDQAPFRRAFLGSTRWGITYLEQEVRATFGELLAASQYFWWVAVVPVIAFLLITGAPGFRRSAERLLPHGHLQWRAGEYFRDVNSALAGYVRAQLGAGVLVGVVCAIGFTVLGLPSALGLGITAGILELVPAIGPVATLLMATSQAEHAAIGVALFLLGVRIVQDYVVYPRLIRRGMHLATPVVVLAIWTGAVFAGAVGVILAIPVAGFLSVSLRHWQEYRAIERLVGEHAKRADPST